MGFNQFIGNAPILATIREQLRKDRLPHSLLFAGIGGIGKRTLAGFISMAVNCLEVEQDFCSHCSSCKKILEHCHPDVRYFVPEGQFIKIGQMRELTREAFFRPFEGRRRVFIIDEAHKMNLESANSILKTLEEPPTSSLIFLISDKLNELLSTIRSRCQIYRFTPLPPSEIKQVLSQRGNYSEAEQVSLSRISGGSIGRALGLDLSQYKAHRQELLDLLEICSNNFLYSKALKSLNSLAKAKEEFENKTEILYSLLHDLFLLKVDASSEYITHWDIRERLLTLSASFPLKQITEGARLLNHIERGAKRNLSRPLVLDQLVFQLSGQLPKGFPLWKGVKKIN